MLNLARMGLTSTSYVIPTTARKANRNIFFRLLHDKLIIMLRSRNIPVSLLKCEMRVKCSVKLFQWPGTTWPGSWTTAHSVCLVNFFGTIGPTHSDSRGVPASVLSQHRTKLTW